MTPDDTPDYDVLAALLDRWRHLSTDVLTAVVLRDGLCFWQLWPGEEPDGLGRVRTQ